VQPLQLLLQLPQLLLQGQAFEPFLFGLASLFFGLAL
jgi:hypothetical protein